MKTLKFAHLIIIAILISSNGFSQKQGIKLIDSLSNKLLKAEEDTNKVNLLIRLSAQYIHNYPDQGVFYGKQALELAERLKWQSGKAHALLNIGDNYLFLSKFDSAKFFCINSLKLYEELKDQDGIADANGDLGDVYLALNNFTEALKYYQKALLIDEKLNHKERSAYTLNNMGIIYINLGRYDVSLPYFKQSLEINKNMTARERQAADNLGNIAIVYDHFGKYKEALDYNLKCLDMYSKIQDSMGIADTYGNIGNNYENLQQFKKAIEFHQKARDMYKARHDSARMALDIASIGTVYQAMYKKDHKKANLDTAVILLQEGIAILRKFHDSTNTRDNLKSLVDADTLKGDYRNALIAFIEATKINDSIFSKQNVAKLAKLETKFDDDKKELERSIREQNEKAQKAREHNIEKSIIWLLIILVFLSIIIARRRLKPIYIRTLTTVAFFIFFEFIYLLIHGSIEKITESPIILLAVLVFAAGILGRVHHKIEHWAVIQFTTVNSRLKSPNNTTETFITMLRQFRQMDNYPQVKSNCEIIIEQYRKAIDYPNFINIDVHAFFSIKQLGTVVAPPIEFLNKNIQKFSQFLVMLFDDKTDIDVRFNEAIGRDWKFAGISEGMISKLLLIHKDELYYYKTKKVNRILKSYGIEFPKSSSVGDQYKETCDYLRQACKQAGIDNFAILYFYLCQEWDKNYA